MQDSSDKLQTISFNSIIANGSTFEVNPINGNLLVTSPIYMDTSGGLQVFGNNGNKVTFQGGIFNGSQTGYLRMKRNSVVELTGASGYTGNTEIDAGRLEIASGGSLSGSSAIFVGRGSSTGTAASLLLTKSDGGRP